MRNPIPVAGALLLSLVSLASGDEWTDALATELAKRTKTKLVLESYEAVIAAKHAHAADACWRRVQLYASQGKVQATKAELERLKAEFPKSYTAARAKALEDLPAFVKLYDTKALGKLVETRKVTLSFSATPIEEVMDFLSEVTGANMVLLPSVDPSLPISLKVKDVALASALKQILAVDGDLELEVTRNMVAIGKDMSPLDAKKWTLKEIEANPALAWKALSQSLSLNFQATPFQDVIGFMREITGIKVTLSQTVLDANPDISLRLKGIPLGEALSLMCGSHGFRWSVSASGIQIDAR